MYFCVNVIINITFLREVVLEDHREVWKKGDVNLQVKFYWMMRLKSSLISRIIEDHHFEQ